MASSIQRRLFLFLLAPLSALLLAGTVAAYLTIRRAALDSLDRQLLAQAHAFAALTELDDGRLSFEYHEAEWRGERPAELSRIHYQAWLADGKPAFRSGAAGAADLPKAASGRAEPIFADFELPGVGAARSAQIDFAPRDEDAWSRRSRNPLIVTLVVAEETRALQALLARVRLAFAGVFAATLAAASAIAVFGLRKSLAPLAAVSEEVDRVTASTLGHRFAPTAVPAEIRPLCLKLNELLARLESSFEREKRFSNDAAHELRTPVAELKTLAEVALADPQPLPEEARAAFADALAVALQLQNIIEGLQVLARCESSQPLPVEEIDLALETAAIWETFAPRAAARGARGDLDLPRGLRCSANRPAAQAVLRNLLSNAAEYVPSGGGVRIRAAAQNGSFELQASNSAPDLDPADAERLFDRFWRKDAARSSPDHCGLGLSVAQAFAARLGWSLRAEISPDRTLTMTLRGPISSAS